MDLELQRRCPERMAYNIAAPNVVINVLDSYTQVEAGIARLCQSGLQMCNISVVGRERLLRTSCAYYGQTGPARRAGLDGEFWSAVWAQLQGWAILLVPDGPPLLVAGPLAEWVVASLENLAVFEDLNALGAALYALAIPRSAALQCEEAVCAGRILLIAHGCASEVERAKEILNPHPGPPH